MGTFNSQRILYWHETYSCPGSSTFKPLAFIVNEANVAEPKIYPIILSELKKKKDLKPSLSEEVTKTL